jgi:hypothetical protein
MPNLGQHPRKGLSPEEAFLRWSEPRAYQELVTLAGTADLPLLTGGNHRFRDRNDEKMYYAKRGIMETAFRERLLTADFYASAIDRYASRREVIHPTLWELLHVHYELDEIVGMGRRYEKPEFFLLDSIPLNVRPIPDWLDAELGAAGLNAFRHDQDYRHIVLHGIEYALSPLHAKVVALLHQAWLNDEPWQPGKDILERAGSTQMKMGDVFKLRADWKAIIDSDSKGMYRLRMDPPAEK